MTEWKVRMPIMWCDNCVHHDARKDKDFCKLLCKDVTLHRMHYTAPCVVIEGVWTLWREKGVDE